MHDIAFIRANPQAFDAAMARRGLEPQSASLLALDAAKRAAQTAVQVAQNRRNEASKLIGQAMARGDREGAEALKAEVAGLKDTMPALEAAERDAVAALQKALEVLPNLPAEDVPEGMDETGNREVARWGTIREFSFAAREHADIGPALGMDFETGAALSGARFTFLRGQIARLHRALAQFMLDHQTGTRGYTECNPPVLVKDEAMFGTGQLPKFGGDSFFAADMSTRERLFWEAMPFDFEEQMASVPDGRFKSAIQALLEKADTAEQFWLIPTSEVSLTNAVGGQILEAAALPLRMTAHTPCFRSEAGSAGRDTRGFIRQHQFEKVELVSICTPEQADAEHAHMLGSAQGILEALGLPYRTMLLCAGDMGAGAKKTFDLEVWLPGQGAWREISSVSWCGDWQARRMDARYRPAKEDGTPEKKTAFVHTLNGSGLAVGRTLVAVMENYQEADGSVKVPEALAPYMGGITRIEPAG